MKLLKWFVIVVLALAALLAGGGMLLSPKFTVSRTVVVNATPEKVYALVENPRRWKEWTVWNRRDPLMQITYFGPEAGRGAGWSWTSASEGDGRMTFTAAEPGRRISYSLYFPDFGTTSAGDLRIASDSQGAKVTWLMNGDMGNNPLFRWMTLFADGMVGKDFEAGLQNLKALAEKS